MKFKFYIYLVILIANLNPIVVDKPNDLVLWKKNDPLKVEDFKGNAELNSVFSAISCFKFETTYYKTNELVIFESKTYFVKNESWFNSFNSDFYLLNHEQKHFDLKEIKNRLVKKELNSFSFSKNYKLEIDSISKITENLIDNIDSMYDRETNYSLDSAKQIFWNLKIDSMLNSLNDFSDSIVYLKLRE